LIVILFYVYFFYPVVIDSETVKLKIAESGTIETSIVVTSVGTSSTDVVGLGFSSVFVLFG
jgi:hypothetical protein